MKTRLLMALTFCATSLTAPQLMAQGNNDLLALLNRVENNQTEEAQRNAERESIFRAEANQQQQLLRDAEAEVAAQEQLREELRETFDSNEVSLGELQANLDLRVGNLGELFGVFRQMADDTQNVLFDSLITLEYPERQAIAEELAASTEVPTIPQMRALWQLLIQEIALSGTVSRFDAEIIEPGGELYQAPAIRVGTFNVISDNNYLNYLASENQLIELARQPQGYIRSSASDLSEAPNLSSVGFYLDPSRGALLGLLVQSPSLGERIEQGKTVGYAIIAVGIFGLLLVAARFLMLARISARMSKQLKNTEQIDLNNPLGRILNIYYENKHLDLETIKRKLDEVVFRDVSDIKKGLSTVKVLAAIAPLMGLLGTVTGMIGTFQAITLFGTGDPKLMAGGISQALITTVLGLCAAIPLLLSHSLLASRVTTLSKTIGEQAAALLAKKAEGDASLAAQG